MVEHKIQLVKLTRNINIKCKIKEDLKKATHKYWLLNSFTKLYLHRIPSADVNVYSIWGGRGGAGAFPAPLLSQLQYTMCCFITLCYLSCTYVRLMIRKDVAGMR